VRRDGSSFRRPLPRRHEGFSVAKDISTATCSLPPSDLIMGSTYSLSRWHARIFVAPAHPPISTTSLTSDVSSLASCAFTHNPTETHDCRSPSCSVRTPWTRTAGGLRRPTPVCALTKTIYRIGLESRESREQLRPSFYCLIYSISIYSIIYGSY
jgi:hypothetical protein